MNVSWLLWVLLAYLCGGIPFAVIIGRLFLNTDIRTVGDGNPGATNVIRAGSRRLGALAIALEIGKGFLPVYLARRQGIADWALLPVALAPILGHAFSPFLHFRGGKALAATGGSWLAIVGPIVFPVYATLTVPVLLLVTEHAWAAVSGMFALVWFAWTTDGPGWLSSFAVLNTLLILWTHRRDLNAPRLRPWLAAIRLPWRTS